jgi:hypothetical protein
MFIDAGGLCLKIFKRHEMSIFAPLEELNRNQWLKTFRRYAAQLTPS